MKTQKNKSKPQQGALRWIETSETDKPLSIDLGFSEVGIDPRYYKLQVYLDQQWKDVERGSS